MKVVRFILFIVNLLLAVGLLLTTLAGGIAPSASPWPSLAAFAYLPLLVANGLMVLVWLLMRRWEALLSIAAVALRWGVLTCWLHVGGATHVPDRSENPHLFSLLSYNVHLFAGPDRHGTTSDSVAIGFLQMVRSELPDVLCLQEFTLPRKVAIVDSLEVMGYNHYYGTHTNTKGKPSGTVIFSRHPITYVSRIDSEKLLADLMIEGERVRVCCVHMTSYKFDDDDHAEFARVRHGEVDKGLRPTLSKVRHTLDAHEKEWNQRLRPIVADCTVPLVLAGDLNEVPSSWLYSQIAHHLHDTFRSCGWGIGSTYGNSVPHLRIDMVFHSAQLRTRSHHPLRSSLSDHRPLLTSMEFIQP